MTAARKLEPSVHDDDAVLAAFRNAPLSDEPETEEEREADLAAIEDYQAGRARTISREEMQATIARMRRGQGG